MRREKTSIAALALLAVLSVCTAAVAQAGEYAAREVIMLAPGDNQTREFHMGDIADLLGDGNVEPFLVVAIGDNETKCGKLSISLSTSAKKEFGAVMDYGIVGFAFSPDAGPVFINEIESTPYKPKASIKLNSVFGFAYAGALIKSVTGGDFDLPAAFTMTFKLAAQEKK